MFYKYDIQTIDGNEVLYLYLTMKYEFSRELNFNDEEKLCNLSNHFIQMNHIPFHGNMVYFVVDGMIVKKVNIQDKNYLNDSTYSPNYFMVHLRLEDHSLCEITLKEYLLGVLFSYYSQDLGDEVLKAICILYNTYAFKCMKSDKEILSNNSFCIYKNINEYKNIYKNYDAIVTRLETIIDFCQCIFLSYQNEYILPFIHFVNSGKTISYIKYPYLSSVKSLWDLTSPNYISYVDYRFSDLKKLLSIPISSKTIIETQNNGNTLKIGNHSFSIYELKSLLHLKSNDICIIVNKDSIRFITKGIGNSLGLSIYGASCIEMNGGKYQHILSYYFPKCKIFRYIKELSK